MKKIIILIAIYGSFAQQFYADTVSEVVGVVTISVAANTSSTVSNPLIFEQGAFDDDGLAEILAGDGSDGDFLHVWTGNTFNTYTLLSGAWNIFGTAVSIPDTRLIAASGTGYMISRNVSGVTEIRFTGKVPVTATETVQVPGKRWALMSFPFPKIISLNDSIWSDSENGDLIKIWDRTNQLWLDYVRDAGAWTGPDTGTQTIDIGTAFLYYNTSSQSKTINFQRPY